VDGLAFAPDGRLLISVSGSATVTGLSTQALDEDLLAFTMMSEGADTGGTWEWYFDGSDVALNTSSYEDVNGVWSDVTTTDLYLSTIGNFAVPGASGQASDVFVCAPGSFGTTTNCTLSLFWDGAAYGFGPEVIDGLSLEEASGGPPPTDTPVPPTDTPVPPTDTPVPPTDTPVPPTDTPVPPTDTPVPPTDTPVPPTDTPTPEPSGPHFSSCVSNTGDNATVGIPSNVTLVGGPILEAGDEVAIFTADGGLCAGTAVWTGANIAITAWGDDGITPNKDGLGAGDIMQFRLWDHSAGTEYVATSATCIKVPGTVTCAYSGGGIYQTTQLNFPVAQSMWQEWVAFLSKLFSRSS
jgi:hypothetical protein